MKTANFLNLVNDITGRDFLIDSSHKELQFESEYFFYRVLPLTGRKVFFKWKTPKTEDKFLRSFITAYTKGYKEPNPRAYDWSARTYGEKARWENKTPIEKEYAYSHHSSNMYSKEQLMQQIQDKFNHSSILHTMLKHGLYPTNYGIGIFILFETSFALDAIKQFSSYLKNKSIPFTNEFSDARWVYRFKLNIDKQTHESILNSFSHNS